MTVTGRLKTAAHLAGLPIDGFDNPIVPIGAGASHGLCSTHEDQVNADLLAFVQA